MSAWPGRVGRPVDGPPRWTSTKTQGVSVMAARPMCSIIREKPGPAGHGHGLLAAPDGALDGDRSGELVLHLDEERPVHERMRAGEALDDLGRRGDRIAGDEAAAGRQGALAAGEVAVDVMGSGEDSFGIGFHGFSPALGRS